MKVHFYSLSKDSKVDYVTEAEVVENSFLFKDEAIPNTMNHMIIYENEIILKRSGDTNGIFRFKLNERTKGEYANDLGLKFKFIILTRRLDVSSKKISIEYDFFIDGEYIDTIKIYLLLK